MDGRRLLSKSELFLQETKEGYDLCKSSSLWNTFLKCQGTLWQEKLMKEADFEIRLVTDDHKDRYPRLRKIGSLLFSFRKSIEESCVLSIFRILMKEGMVQLNPLLSFRVNKALTKGQHELLKAACEVLSTRVGQLIEAKQGAKDFLESVHEFELQVKKLGLSSLTAVKIDATTIKERCTNRDTVLKDIFHQDVSYNWSAKESLFLGKTYLPTTVEQLVLKLHYISFHNSIDGIDSWVLRQEIKRYLSTRTIAVDNFLAEMYLITFGPPRIRADWYDLNRYISQGDLRVICQDIFVDYSKEMKNIASNSTQSGKSSAVGLFTPVAKGRSIRKTPPIYLYRLATKSKEERQGLVLYFSDPASGADFLQKTDLSESKSIYQHAEHKNCLVFETGISRNGEIKIDFPTAGILDNVMQELDNLGVKKQSKEFKVEGQQQVKGHYFNIGVSRFIGKFIIEGNQMVDKSNTLYLDLVHPLTQPGTCLKVDANENRVSKITGDDSFPLMDHSSHGSQCRLM